MLSEACLAGFDSNGEGLFAELTLSPFVALRAVRSGRANGLRMTNEEPPLPSTPLRDSERIRTESEAKGLRMTASKLFSAALWLQWVASHPHLMVVTVISI